MRSTLERRKRMELVRRLYTEKMPEEDMTIEEAIKILHPDTTAEALGGYVKEYAMNVVEEACIVACKALEKQIPKKPTDVRYFGEAGYYIGLCPCCNSGNNSEYQYCGDCGQAIDWSEEE